MPCNELVFIPFTLQQVESGSVWPYMLGIACVSVGVYFAVSYSRNTGPRSTGTSTSLSLSDLVHSLSHYGDIARTWLGGLSMLSRSQTVSGLGGAQSSAVSRSTVPRPASAVAAEPPPKPVPAAVASSSSSSSARAPLDNDTLTDSEDEGEPASERTRFLPVDPAASGSSSAGVGGGSPARGGAVNSSASSAGLPVANGSSGKGGLPKRTFGSKALRLTRKVSP